MAMQLTHHEATILRLIANVSREQGAIDIETVKYHKEAASLTRLVYELALRVLERNGLVRNSFSDSKQYVEVTHEGWEWLRSNP